MVGPWIGLTSGLTICVEYAVELLSCLSPPFSALCVAFILLNGHVVALVYWTYQGRAFIAAFFRKGHAASPLPRGLCTLLCLSTRVQRARWLYGLSEQQRYTIPRLAHGLRHTNSRIISCISSGAGWGHFVCVCVHWQVRQVCEQLVRTAGSCMATHWGLGRFVQILSACKAKLVCRPSDVVELRHYKSHLMCGRMFGCMLERAIAWWAYGPTCCLFLALSRSAAWHVHNASPVMSCFAKLPGTCWVFASGVVESAHHDDYPFAQARMSTCWCTGFGF